MKAGTKSDIINSLLYIPDGKVTKDLGILSNKFDKLLCLMLMCSFGIFVANISNNLKGSENIMDEDK